MILEVVLISLFVLAFPVWSILARRRRLRRWPPVSVSFSSRLRKIFSRKVPFYQALPANQKRRFVSRVLRFLQGPRISASGTRINEVDVALVGASAIIPVFRLDHWRYRGLDEIVVFGPSFDRRLAGHDREGRIVGLLGEGEAEGKMFLCRDALHRGFEQEGDADNTAIHEFVHLIDKMDGRVDGIPKLLMRRQYVLPWLKLIKRKIGEIKDGQSDLNPYAAMGNEEFLAVAAEYFFEKPEEIKEAHPVLHRALERIFENPA